MRRFALSAEERWPVLGLMEVDKGNPSGYELPIRLVNKWERLNQELDRVEKEIMEQAGVTWEALGG